MKYFFIVFLSLRACLGLVGRTPLMKDAKYRALQSSTNEMVNDSSVEGIVAHLGQLACISAACFLISGQ
ncbi:unnamed protein product [Prunus armeniaca]